MLVCDWEGLWKSAVPTLFEVEPEHPDVYLRSGDSSEPRFQRYTLDAPVRPLDL